LSTYIYTFNYDYHLEDLCRLEARQLFGTPIEDKLLFAYKEIDPSISAFIKTQLEIHISADSYEHLIVAIKSLDIEQNGFNVEYLILDNNTIERGKRREMQKEIGFCIYGYPEFTSPTITYAFCHYHDKWYFGTLTKHNNEWYKHKVKPHSFSNSIDMDIAKTLVSIAARGDKTKTLIDACCGVGTALLEGHFGGFSIEGCDINERAVDSATKNLAHYGYPTAVYCTDIKDLDRVYDAAIVDLPYNVYSLSDEATTENIISSVAQLAPRAVVVSIADVSATIEASGLQIVDTCTVVKKGKSTFTRKFWVCEKADILP